MDIHVLAGRIVRLSNDNGISLKSCDLVENEIKKTFTRNK